MKKKQSMRSIWLHLVLGSMFLVPFGSPGQAQAETITLPDQAAYDAYVVASGISDVVPSGSSSGNTVTIGTAGATGPTITGYVVGGDSRNGDPTAANNNTVTVTGSSVKGVIGGYVVISGDDTATVSGNTITVQDSTVESSVYNKAFASGDGNAMISGNTITVQDSTVEEEHVYNTAYTIGDGNATTSGNTITLQNSTVKHQVHNKAYTLGDGNATTSGNTITVQDSTVESSVYNTAYTIGAGNAMTSGNTIALQDSTLESSVYNSTSAQGAGNATTSGNTINVTGSTVGYNVKNAASTDTGDATVDGNTINITGSTVEGDTSVKNNAYMRNSGGTGTVTASNNTINITDSTVNIDIYAGWADSESNTNTLIADNNNLNIKGTVDLSGSNLYGGVQENYIDNTKTMGKNNTLNMYSKDVTAKSVSYFNNYNFYLPAGTKAGDTMLTLTDGATDLTGSVTDVRAVADDFSLQVGDKVKLISNANGVTVDPAQPTEVTAEKNVALDYNMVLDHDANNLYATIKGVNVNERTKSFLEGRLGASMFVNKGADIIGDNSILSKLTPDKKYAGIAVLDYGKEKAATGSSVEVKGLSMLLGFGKAVDNGKGTLRWAPFIEAGWGRYNTENEFLNYADSNVKGDTDYYGVGFMARKTGESGNYIEGSVRAGRVGDDYSSDLSHNGKTADYDITTTYYGAHIGLGKLMVHDKYDLDVFAKYFYNKVKGDDVSIFATDYSFDDTTSNRFKLGFKYTGKLSKNNTWFGGAAWEYEMSGSQRGTVSGYDIAAPDYKGSTGVVTAGYSYTPDDKKYDVDFSLSERFGKRHGLSARVNCRFKI